MFFDFVEIGTSDFDTLIQEADETTKGLSIDPVADYLNNLPNPKNCIKINAAISNYNGETSVYHIPPESIKKYNLPHWVRGCNTIGTPHPTIDWYLKNYQPNCQMSDLIVEKKVPTYTLTTLLRQHKVSGVFLLKIDTEGHDAAIINHFFDEASRNLYPHRILFESNWLANNEEIHRLIARLITLGYDIIHAETGGSDSNTFLRLNINRLHHKSLFSGPLHGHYLQDYPENYLPQQPPHQNTLKDAINYCVEHRCGGVTYQYGRFEVRKGDYLIDSKEDKTMQSWVFL